jgi:hypothetical protein
MDMFVASSSAWKKITSMYVASGGVWKQVTAGYVASGGVWKSFFSSSNQYSFSFGKHLFVGSNGYIGLEAGGTTAGTMGAGRNISIYNKDLQQWYLAEYSDTSTYSLYFRS